jgi:Uma2 family endonuclease
VVLTRTELTLEEFLRLPEKKPALEYEDGEVTQKMSPKRRHATLQAATAEMFNVFARPRRLGRAFTEQRVVLPSRSYVIDVAYYSMDRIPVDAEGDVEDGSFEELPDIAVEILSPRQEVTPLLRRCAWYVGNGARAALFVDGADRTVFLFRPGDSVRPIRGDQAIELDDVLPGLRLTAGDLFAALRLR